MNISDYCCCCCIFSDNYAFTPELISVNFTPFMLSGILWIKNCNLKSCYFTEKHSIQCKLVISYYDPILAFKLKNTQNSISDNFKRYTTSKKVHSMLRCNVRLGPLFLSISALLLSSFLHGMVVVVVNIATIKLAVVHFGLTDSLQLAAGSSSKKGRNFRDAKL